ncbi:MAG TPA: ABC transporter substrate-binding protein, partial [Candidatus Eremiobacteraceae bacterium]|nr:ABC transporter substrate-binding protein [Candidatus Eremiobacteraceae bacterium]
KVSTSGGIDETGNRATVHGIVRLAILAEPNTLNPVLSGLIQEGYMEGAIFNGLVKLDSRGNILPDLATDVPSLANGGISKDGKTITYHLRHGVTWQDGAPLTSDDVAFTYSAYVNPKVNSFWGGTYRHITSISTPDAYTAVLHLKKPFAPAITQFFERGTGGFVVPKHILEKSADINTDPFGKHPVGTGAFRLERWDHGSLIVLKPNPHYFGGAPKLREIDVHIVANPNTQMAMIGSHELDVAVQLTPAQYPQVKAVAGIHAILVPTLLERFITFNLKREPFTDLRVRRALALALDRDRIVATAYLGTATRAQTLVPPTNWAYDPTGAPPYDPALAKSLLDQAGWIAGPEGMRAKNGRPLTFALLNQTEQNTLSTMVQEIQRAWRDVGVAVDIKAVPRNVIYGNPDGVANSGKFDSLLDDWGADPDPDRSLLTETKNFSPHGWNDAFYSNPEVDRWSEEAVATFDLATRKRFYSLIQRQMNRDLPFIPLAWDGRIYAVNTDLRGFSPEPVFTDFWNVETWQI